jgi:hypothetical protein
MWELCQKDFDGKRVVEKGSQGSLMNDEYILLKVFVCRLDCSGLGL